MNTQNPTQLKASDVPKLRKRLLKKQNGKCLICGKIPDSPALDHHHTKKIHGTGLIRGVLCRGCNIFLAKSENNCMRYGISQEELPQILRSMASYLERKHLPYIHPSEAPKRKILKKSSYNKLAKVCGKKLKPYRARNGRNLQTLTKPLDKLFKLNNIRPEFYK